MQKMNIKNTIYNMIFKINKWLYSMFFWLY